MTRCTVCASEHRASIELGLVNGLSYQLLADRYGPSRDAIGRHARSHLTPAAAAALLVACKPSAIDLDALTEQEGSGLLANLVVQRARLTQYAERAMADGQTSVAVQCERVVATNLEITGKLLQRFVMRHEHRHTSILLTPDWMRLRQVLVSTLRQFPEAARAVAAELAKLESTAAETITAGKTPLLIEATHDRH